MVSLRAVARGPPPTFDRAASNEPEPTVTAWERRRHGKRDSARDGHGPPRNPCNRSDRPPLSTRQTARPAAAPPRSGGTPARDRSIAVDRARIDQPAGPEFLRAAGGDPPAGLRASRSR